MSSTRPELRRSWLYVPGHRHKLVDKALGLDVDAVVLDLEDGVPLDEKEVARGAVAAALAEPMERPRLFVRVSSAESGLLDADLRAVVHAGLDGLVLAKTEGPEQIAQLDSELAALEKGANLPRGRIELVALIESARGLVQAPAIAAGSARMSALMFGAEDFALDMGLLALGCEDAGVIDHARPALAVAAASQQLQAIDKVFLDIDDADGLLAETRRARALGFSGKCAIHPAQIEVVHRGFMPTAHELELARRIVATAAEAEAAGSGAAVVDGRMIDRPIVERARRALACSGEES